MRPCGWGSPPEGGSWPGLPACSPDRGDPGAPGGAAAAPGAADHMDFNAGICQVPLLGNPAVRRYRNYLCLGLPLMGPCPRPVPGGAGPRVRAPVRQPRGLQLLDLPPAHVAWVRSSRHHATGASRPTWGGVLFNRFLDWFVPISTPMPSSSPWLYPVRLRPQFGRDRQARQRRGGRCACSTCAARVPGERLPGPACRAGPPRAGPPADFRGLPGPEEGIPTPPPPAPQVGGRRYGSWTSVDDTIPAWRNACGEIGFAPASFQEGLAVGRRSCGGMPGRPPSTSTSARLAPPARRGRPGLAGPDRPALGPEPSAGPGRGSVHLADLRSAGERGP